MTECVCVGFHCSKHFIFILFVKKPIMHAIGFTAVKNVRHFCATQQLMRYNQH